MTTAHQSLRVLLWTSTAKTTLVADLTGRFTALEFSTALHGGFKDCHLAVPMPMQDAWLWLNRENLPGHHFHHLGILEATRTVWEGRVMDVTLVSNAGFLGIDAVALGYWSSMRDQYYDADDAGNTNWQTAGPHNAGKIIREMVTNECPDINGTLDIDLNSRDIVGINLTDRNYPQDIIVDKLAPLSDSDGKLYFFGVWEDRKPSWKARAADRVDWYVWLRDIRQARYVQQAVHLRNRILPVVGTAEGTGTTDAESTADYPLRELKLSLPAGLPTAAANDARDAALKERKFPAQDQAFIIDGRVYSTEVGPQTGPSAGALVERSKWWIRAGDVLRIQDLVPASVSTPKLDDLRTFFILETRYDAITDVLTVQPDRPPSRLGALLARISLLEKNK